MNATPPNSSASTEPSIPNQRPLWRRILRVVAWVTGGLLLVLGLLAGVLWWYQDTIFRNLQTYLKRQLNGTLTVGYYRAAFERDPAETWIPGLIVTLRDVHLRDADFPRHHTELLSAREMNLKVGFWGFLGPDLHLRNVTLTGAKIDLLIDSSGRTNFSLSHADSTKARSKSKGDFPDDLLSYLHRGRFRDVQVRFRDGRRNKTFAARFQDVRLQLQEEDDAHAIHLIGPVYFGGLTFNAAQGPFLGNRATNLALHARFDPEERRLTVDPSILRTSTDLVRISGQFDFPKDSVPRLNLRFQTDKLPLRRGLALVTPHLQRVMGKYGAFPVVRTLDVRLSGAAGPGEPPAVDILFDLDTFRYRTMMGELTNLRTQGTFSNHVNPARPRDDVNSRVKFNNIRGQWEDLVPLSGSLQVDNLIRPVATMLIHASTPLDSLNERLTSPKYRFGEGYATADVRFRGEVSDVFDRRTGRLRGTLKGAVKVRDGVFYYLPRKVQLTKIGGEVYFNEKDAWVRDFHATANGSPLHVDGLVRQLIPFLAVPNQKLIASARIRSENFEVNASRFQPVKATANPERRGARRHRVALSIDQVVERIEADLTLQLDRFRYRKFAARNLRGQLLLNSKLLKMNDVGMDAFGGTFRLRGRVDYLDQRPSLLTASCTIKNAQVEEIFTAFENFGQPTITAQQIRGRWSSEGTFRAYVDTDYGPLPETMRGDMRIQLRDGALIKFAPLKRLQKFIFKQRDFDNVRFATIQNHFRLLGQDIQIDQMEVESSVLTLFIDGRYSLDSTRTNLRIQVPLSNLRRRDSTYLLSRHDPFKGSNVFLRASDESGEMKIRLDRLGRRKPETAIDSVKAAENKVSIPPTQK
ncbi:MAG: hypothetical protein H7Y12_09950 [Sphingobacteriaceae bacterium]|nr:hypothetical protein [Cytophagaceae bacterium]